jgi:hypothetical protein
LRAWWACWPYRNNLWDLSGRGQHASFTGLTAASWSARLDDVGTGLVYASGQYASIAYGSTVPAQGSVTWAAWLTVTGAGADQQLIADSSDATILRPRSSAVTNNGPIFFVFNGTTYVSASYGTSLVAGTVYHLCGTYDGANVRLYVNGILRGGPTAQTGTTPSYGTNYFGVHQNTTSNPFVGTLYELRWYSRALSASEVWALYDPLTRWELYTPSKRGLSKSGVSIIPIIMYHRKMHGIS